MPTFEDEQDWSDETLDLVAQVANAALREVGLPEEFQLYVEVNGCAYFEGDNDPPDGWDHHIEKALELAWAAAGEHP